MQTNTNTADISKLLALPAIRDAMNAQLASEENNAAEARKAVIEQLKSAEAKLARLQQVQDENAVEIEALRRKTNELLDKGYEIHNKMNLAKSNVIALSRSLDKQHGGEIINTISRQLQVAAANLRDEATRLQANRKQSMSRFGERSYKPCPESQAKATANTDKAALIDRARMNIEALRHEAISPQEIRRQIATALASIGVKVIESKQECSGWQDSTWLPSKQAA